MNSTPASVVGILDRLSIGVSRISIRHGHTKPKVKKPRPELTGFKKGLGERIWVHNHIATGMIIYSHDGDLKRDSVKGLAQIPFTVRKQKPPVLREDYWTPMCLIELPRGQGVVGRNVMQKLQEFRRRHELEWGYQAEELIRKSKIERGQIIHNQKSNAVADMAAVLAGAGRGNKVWKGALAEALQAPYDPAAEGEEKKAEAEAGADVEAAKAPAPKAEADSKSATPTTKTALVTANIYWSNNGDLYWARKWTDNVEHHHGLPDHVKNHRFKLQYTFDESEGGEPEATEGEATKEVAAEAKVVSEPEVKPEPKEEPKKGLFSWFGGKSGSSGTDARP